jgi:predicted GTPase
MTERVLIMGAAGRDFHDFNTAYRGHDDAEVVAFTAAPGQNLGETEQGGHDRYPPNSPARATPRGFRSTPSRNWNPSFARRTSTPSSSPTPT